MRKKNDISNVHGMCGSCVPEEHRNWCFLFALSVVSPSPSSKSVTTFPFSYRQSPFT